MAEYRFGSLTMDPVRNPAVLDTATWDPAGACECLLSVPAGAWTPALAALGQSEPIPMDRVTFLPGSWARRGEADWLLARLSDGQQVLLCAGPAINAPASAICNLKSSICNPLSAYPATAENVEWFVRRCHPQRGPRALGPVPRLGIGTRMSTSVWPGTWPALERLGVASNAIQNSVRELNLLDDLVACRPARGNYMFGFGTLYEGHTGSTFEGLWLAGVLSALTTGFRGPFGADADHIMVKRGPDGLERARQVIDAARRYTFYTLDVSDLLDYAAMDPSRPADLAAVVPDAGERRELLAFHGDRGLSEESVVCAAAKHWLGLAAVAELAAHVTRLKGGIPFDLELSVDETPPGIRALEVLTAEEELAFLLGEIRRRGLPVTHVAPNFGVEKGVDYLGSDGLAGLEARVRRLHRLVEGQGILLDCHSGDDLSAATRRAVGRATGGRVHFKISPMLQELFAEVLCEGYPERFRFWWEDAMAYARREAEAGSELAARCIREFEDAVPTRAPSSRHRLFHYYGFATVGRRDPEGGFVHRPRFYELPDNFTTEYARRVTALLCEVAADVLRPLDE